MAAVEIAAESLRPMQRPDPDLTRALPRVQARLAALIDADRAGLPTPRPAGDRLRADPMLAEAEALAETTGIDAALVHLGQAQVANPEDPRIPFQVAELLLEAGRYAEAVTAYRRTLHLDASRAKVFFGLGLAYRGTGDPARAVYAFGQAAVRAGESSTLRRRADWEVVKLTFTIVLEAGFADGSGAGDTPVGVACPEFQEGDRQLAWWARIHPRFRHFSDTFVLRWTAPDGRVVREEPVEKLDGLAIGSILELDDGAATGTWTAELLLRGDSIDRRSVAVRPL
jgi:tetratricopeptide (TPR) repeat protein